MLTWSKIAFYVCLICVPINLVNSYVAFKTDNSKAGWEDILWAGLMIVCAFFNSKSISRLEGKKDGKDV